MNNYDDSQRMDDAFALSKRELSEAEQALAVLLCAEQIRPMLEVLDPQSVAQARKALRLSEFPFSDRADARYIVRLDARESWFITDTLSGKVTTRTPGGGSMTEAYARTVAENLNRDAAGVTA